MKTEEVMSMVIGRTKTILAPSGRTFVIREQNGEDDDIISNPVTQSDLSNMDFFIQAIVQYEVKDDGSKVPLTIADCENLLIRDRVAIIIESRVFSLGNMINFSFAWKEGEEPIEYFENLTKFLWDYTKDFPYDKNDPDYFKYRIEPYPENANEDFLFGISSGKQFKFNLLTRKSEKFLLKLPTEQVTRNAELIARNLSYQLNDTWVKVQNFKMFSKAEMIEIHKAVKELDPPYNAFTEIVNPTNPKEKVEYPILSYNDFFFPVEI